MDGRERAMEFLFWCAILLGIFCIGYYIIIILYVGTGVNFAWIWCFGGICCISSGVILRYLILTGFPALRWLLHPTYALIVIAVIIFLSLECILLFNSHHKAGRGMDYLLVLGAQISGNKVTKNLSKRLDTAIAYLNQNRDTLVIVTGGRGTEHLSSEAAVMKAYLLDQGIDHGRILTEEQSVNTTGNIKYSKELMRENATVAIVTNGFHIFRSTRLARKQGMNKVFALVAPTDKVMCLHYYVREAAGVLKDGFLGNL
jgi:uncharacterized SAM-binding protein YcdF (DUF218 family)